MKTKQPFIIASIMLILLFAVSLVSASIDVNTYTPSKDFSVTSAYSDISICSCSTKYDSFTVTNTGTWPAIFTVNTNQIKSKFTISQNTFELSPGQSTEVFLYITADCNKGSETLKITVTSNLGTQKSLIKNIARERCQNIEMWVANYTKDIKPCQSKTFEITVHNIGPFAESYVLSSNNDKYITYNTNKFNLEPNNYTKVIATAKFDCDMYGSKDIVFTAQAVKNKLTASIDAQLNILQDYDYIFAVNNDNNNVVGTNVCNRVLTTQIPVSITNTGSIANNYTIQIDDLPKFAKVVGLDYEIINLKPGERKSFYIDVDATVYRYEHKSKEVTLKVIPEIGDIVKETQLNLNFLPCYEHEVVIYDGKNSARKPLETCSNKEYTYDIEIINNGAFKETYILALDGAPSTIKLSKNKITVAPGQRDTVKLLIRGPEYNTDYNIQVKATTSNGLIESDNTWIKSYDTQTCHTTIIGKNNYKVNYQTQYINVPIENTGMVDNAYIVSWDGSSIISADDYLLSLNKSQDNKIALKIHSRNKNESTYNGIIVVQEASGASYSKEITVTLKDKSAARKVFEYLAFGTVCRQFSLYQIIAILAVILLTIGFIIKGPHYQYNFWNRFKSKAVVLLLLIVLFFVGVVLVVSLVGLPQTQAQVYNLTSDASELKYEWLQDDKYVLDVSQFFYDPENATLKYEVVGLNHIKAVNTGKSITFYSEYGWSGVEYANITAYDSLGGNVTSPKFTLMVRNIPKKSMTEIYNLYCWYFNLVIYAILLIFIFIAVFAKQSKRTRK